MSSDPLAASAATGFPRFLSMRPAAATAFIGLLFAALSAAFIGFGLTPRHDAIDWFAGYHYFYDSIAHGVIPFWNPYSQAGTPFYPYFQALGLWEPSNYLFILLMKASSCSTLTAYLLHYFFYYFLFIAGSYHAIRLLTRRNDVSLLLALVLLMGTFPSAMVQNGALNSFFWLPFLTYCLLKFLEEDSIGSKGRHLFAASFLCALACLCYIPAGLIFFLMVFTAAALLTGAARLSDLRRFFASPRGLAWLGASLACSALIIAPVLALHLDMKAGHELFPLNRAIFTHGFRLPKLFSASFIRDVFDKAAIQPVSVTLANLAGLILEPFRIPFLGYYSEIVLYIGVLPLMWALAAALRFRRRDAILMLMLAAASLLVMTNLRFHVDDPESLFQKWLAAAVPGLGKIEVFENFGFMFLFFLLVLAALGLSHETERTDSFLWTAALWIMVYKNCMSLPLMHHGFARTPPLLRFTVVFFFITILLEIFASLALHLAKRESSFPRLLASAGSQAAALGANLAFYLFVPAYFLSGRPHVSHPRRYIAALMILAAIMLRTMKGLELRRRFINWSRAKIWLMMPLLLFLDLCFFDIAYLSGARTVGNYYAGPLLRTDYPALLKKEAEKKSPRHGSSPDYRRPFARKSHDYAFFAPEILGERKVALPAIIGNLGTTPMDLDALFSTGRYYDYLTHVAVERQLPASAISRPILDFYPLETAKLLKDRYAAIEGLDRAGGKRFVFLEKAEGPRALPPMPKSSPSQPPRYFKLNLHDYLTLTKRGAPRFPPERGFRADRLRFGPNRLDAAVRSPADGYLYFSDGYSRHWKAFLDARQVPIFIANVAFKAIRVSKGRHQVEFIYDPRAIRHSMIASLIGVFLAAAVAVAAFLGPRFKAAASS